jgi:hypothetical protein
MALLLGLIPGMGHLYLERRGRAFLYPLLFAAPICFAFLLIVGNGGRIPGGGLLFLLVLSFMAWAINMIDLVITIASRSQFAAAPRATGDSGPEGTAANGHAGPAGRSGDPANERFYTILLSTIPGLGHFQLGLMQRGAVFLTGFFGMTAMIFFVAFITGRGSFLVFLVFLPAIWLYSLFDALRLLQRKQRGEAIEDRSIFEDFEQSREEGRKSKMIATVLAVFPGAGHMYLGLQRRGLQLMAAFLLSIYILDVLRLSIFLFIIPLLWFYSLFDALQHISRHGREEPADVPFVDWFIHHQRWVGIGLLLLGAYYLVDRLVIPGLSQTEAGRIIALWYHKYLQTFIVSVLLIGGGLKLLLGKKRR